MQQPSQELYSRGKYKLAWDARKDGTFRTPYLQIVWYDQVTRRNRSRSTGTESIVEAEKELDALYLKRERGQAVCASCGQTLRDGARHLATAAIADYLVAREGRASYDAIQSRLAMVTRYLTDGDRQSTACEDIDEDWIQAFREWAILIPVTSTAGNILRDRSPSTVEASVRQLAAAINFAHARKDSLFPAGFTAKAPEETDRTPAFRADIKTLAAMFRYCVAPADKTAHNTVKRMTKDREQLLRFLRVSVATWARPDAAHDVSTDRARDQWHSNARALNLNQKGRAQTKKHRPIVPIGARMAALLDANGQGFYVSVGSVQQAFGKMQTALKLPGNGESGMKLIRRSVAHLARQRLGERDWVEGQIMLGHRKLSTSDTYAPFDTGYLARALEVTDSIIAEIEALCPGAFSEA